MISCCNLPPSQVVFLFAGRSRQNIISYISSPRCGVDLGGNFKTIFWPDPILQVRLHPGIWCFYPSHLSDCQNFDLFVFRSWWLPGNLGTEHARKSIMSERLYLAGGVKWGKILLIIGLNESFELYLGLAWQGQVSSYVTSRAIRDLLSYLPVRADTILDTSVCLCARVWVSPDSLLYLNINSARLNLTCWVNKRERWEIQ